MSSVAAERTRARWRWQRTAPKSLRHEADGFTDRKFRVLDQGVAWQTARAIDGVPVIAVAVHARDQEGWAVVIDLARFGELSRGTSAGPAAVEPELALLQPDDPLREPSGGTAPGNSHDPSSQLGLMQVQVTLSLSADITVNDPSAIRVIRIVEAAGAPR